MYPSANKFNLITVFLISCILSVFSFNAYASLVTCRYRSKAFNRPNLIDEQKQVDGLTVSLQLTSEQKSNIKQLIENNYGLRDLWKMFEELRIKKIRLIRQESFDEPAIKQFGAEISKVYLELSLVRARVYSELDAILIPDHKQKLVYKKNKLADLLDEIFKKNEQDLDSFI